MNDQLKNAAFKYRALLINLDRTLKAVIYENGTVYEYRAREYHAAAQKAVEDFESDYEDDLHLIVEFSERYLG